MADERHTTHIDDASLNGKKGTDDPLSLLRERPQNPHLLGGFGPVVVGVVLFLLMVLLAPSVSPEHVIERPIETTPTTAAP